MVIVIIIIIISSSSSIIIIIIISISSSSRMLTGVEANLKTHLDAYRRRGKFEGTSRCLLLYLRV